MIEGMSIFELREHEGDTMNDLVAGNTIMQERVLIGVQFLATTAS